MSEPAAYDVAIAGGGPAGAACATLCAKAGLRTVVVERSRFPRDKVCGDCVNPGCWPVLEELGVVRAVLDSPHIRIASVAFIGPDERRIELGLEGDSNTLNSLGEIAISRRLLDSILLQRAEEVGAEVFQQTTLLGLSRDDDGVWKIATSGGAFSARHLVAADGRNSTVARLLGAAPPARRDRVGLQAHAPAATRPGEGIELHLFRDGYCGVAPVGEGLTNYCMVATAARLDSLKAAATARFGIAADQEWQAIAPLERAPIGPLRDGVLYTGDAACVVEPFTGEGIYYALQSGALAARQIVAGAVERYPAAHAALYRRRLWINRLARWAVTHPRAGASLLKLMSGHPASLDFLVKRVTRSTFHGRFSVPGLT
jgi:geranylgeranyl reductase family protein